MATKGWMDAVWDDAGLVLRSRWAVMLPVALLAFVVPGFVQAALRLFPMTGAAGVAVLALLVSVVGLVLSLWGALAIIALAGDPAPPSRAATQAASRRLPPAMGVAAVLAVAGLLMSLPLGVVAALAGLDMQAMSRGAVPAMRGGSSPVVLGSLLLLGLLLWLVARLLPVQAVVLHERRGLGAIGAAFRSTRGLAARLVAAELVFAAVVLVASLATQVALGTVLLVVLGPDRVGVALLLTAVLSNIVSAALTVVGLVFVARLYALLRTGAARDAGAAAAA